MTEKDRERSVTEAGSLSPAVQRDVYEIRVEGHLDSHWVEWFEGLSMTHEKDGTTVLAGPVGDQSALHGLLAKVRGLGLPLLSVNRVDS